MKKLLLLTIIVTLLASCKYSMDEPEGVDKGHFYGDLDVENSRGHFSMEDVEVSVTQTPADGKYTLMFHLIKFSDAMPVYLDIIVPGVEIDKNGAISGNNIIPIAKDEPYEKYEVTNLTGTYTTSTLELDLEFGSYPTHFFGTTR